MNNNADMDNEALKKRLQFQGGPGLLENPRKRASDESDDSSSGTSKRPQSKLQEKNKMLASLLACPSRPINSPNLQMPAVRMMPDIPSQKRHESGLPSPLGSQPTTPNQPTPTSKSTNNNNSATKNNNLKSAQQKFRSQPLGQMRGVPGGQKVGEPIYLSQISQQMQQQQMAGRVAIGGMLSSQANSSSGAFDAHQFVSSTPAITSAPASSSTIQQAEWDPELNDILENFIEFDESSFSTDDPMNYQQMNANANAQLKQQEELAQINKIQQSLMECENEDNFTGSPPAYPIHGLTAQSRLQQQQGFNQPPPGYNQRNIRLPMNVTSNNNVVTNSNTATVAQATNSQQGNKQQPTQALLQRMQQQHTQRLLQLQQKERLLQQQQNQQIVVTGGSDQLCKLMNSIPIWNRHQSNISLFSSGLSNTSVQSIDSLMNNSVAPNVTLTSRGGTAPDSQLSPNFAQTLMQQLSPNQQRGNTPFSPQANQSELNGDIGDYDDDY